MQLSHGSDGEISGVRIELSVPRLGSRPSRSRGGNGRVAELHVVGRSAGRRQPCLGADAARRVGRAALLGPTLRQKRRHWHGAAQKVASSFFFVWKLMLEGSKEVLPVVSDLDRW